MLERHPQPVSSWAKRKQQAFHWAVSTSIQVTTAAAGVRPHQLFPCSWAGWECTGQNWGVELNSQRRVGSLKFKLRQLLYWLWLKKKKRPSYIISTGQKLSNDCESAWNTSQLPGCEWEEIGGGRVSRAAWESVLAQRFPICHQNRTPGPAYGQRKVSPLWF